MKKYLTAFSSKIKGSVFGGILLLSGSCIGIGMLVLPIVSGLAGFLPSCIIFITCWIFMISTAFLVLELLLQYPDRFSFISLAEKILGKTGKIITWIFFLLLFYSIIIAYIVKGGSLIQQALLMLFPIDTFTWIGPLVLTVITSITISISTRFVDNFNRIFMYGLFLIYFYLLTFGRTHAHWNFLSYKSWNYSLVALPILIVSFGFHNMLPTIKQYLSGDKKRLTWTVLIGGLIPLVVYFIWVIHILTIVPPTGGISIFNSFIKEEISTEPLAFFSNKQSLFLIVQFFAFFAIITSLFGQSLSVLDFIADGIKISKKKLNRLFISGLIFIPTFYLSQTYPNIFFKTLNFAGGILAIILFGIMPVLMVWKKRYHDKNLSIKFFPGGKFSLIIIFLFALFILIYEIIKI